MKLIQIAAGCLVASLLVSCASKAENLMNKEVSTMDMPKPGTILFEDSMEEDWQENWFLDGKRAILGHTTEGLWIFCTPSGVNKKVNRAKFDSHHAVLWTKQEFEGDIRITYDFARRGTSLLYIQAQGIGTPPYEKDIYEWRNLREVAAMKKYHDYMTLRSLSFRENIRFKRYPWSDRINKGGRYNNVLVRPMIQYDGAHGNVNVEQFCRVVVESRKDSLYLRIEDANNPENVIEHTWDAATSGADPNQPVFTQKGRIGLRNMGGCWARYANFKVEQL